MEKFKVVVIALASLLASLGFYQIATNVEILPAQVEVVVTAISALVSTITALYTDLKKLFGKNAEDVK